VTERSVFENQRYKFSNLVYDNVMHANRRGTQNALAVPTTTIRLGDTLARFTHGLDARSEFAFARSRAVLVKSKCPEFHASVPPWRRTVAGAGWQASEDRDF